ncbi:transcriptional regulator [Neokomagataea anthophila]|uniref:Helix-turn-helix domain-containing protein n=1 Tax=Neokomagataea anthophila TaxID=2826925 RepID=A0ABS5E8D9_9PROT|nr:YdaS family helix-turn-helix protein [Neokomagataea anthophila]MBR0560071.1 helix-turn-helix domain-containing protein [Neokomagataea anthophila]
MSIVDEAITAAGGALELSKACNLHRTSVLFWRYRDRIPANHVVAVEEKTGIPRERLRPDLYREITPSRRSTRKEAVHV